MRRSKNARLFSVCLLLVACSAGETSWFPLEAGYWWQYGVERSIKGEPHKLKLIVANLPVQQIGGRTLYPRKRPDGRLEYFEKAGKAVYRVDIDDKSRVQLLPGDLSPGSSWQSTSRILFLEVTGAFEATFNRRIKQDILMEYEIDSVDALHDVPAGRYRNCLHVKGRGSLYGGGGSLKEYMGIDSINIEVEEWYAPGVGLIERTRREFTLPQKYENHYSEVLEVVRAG